MVFSAAFYDVKRIVEIDDGRELSQTRPASSSRRLNRIYSITTCHKTPFIAKFCKSLVGTGVELTNSARATMFIAESLTTIAIKLHRQSFYPEVGLQIFEQLLALNFRETRSALETLDRKPNRPGLYIAPRRRLRSRRPFVV